MLFGCAGRCAMHFPKPNKTIFPAALLLMHLLSTAASASPLWGSEPAPRRAEPSWSPADTTRLLQADPWFDTAAKEPLPQFVPVREAVRGGAPADWDAGASFGMPAEAARSGSASSRGRTSPRGSLVDGPADGLPIGLTRPGPRARASAGSGIPLSRRHS